MLIPASGLLMCNGALVFWGQPACCRPVSGPVSMISIQSHSTLWEGELMSDAHCFFNLILLCFCFEIQH